MTRVANVGALAALGAAALATAAVSLVTLNRIKDAAIAASMSGRCITPAILFGSLRPVDVVLLILAVGSTVFLVLQEWRSRAWSRLLATATEREALIWLLIVTAWCGHAYLNPGVLLGGDSATHIARFEEISRGLRAGTLAQWTNFQYCGEPLLWFTGPLTYVVGGTLAFLVGSALLAAKLLLFGLHLLTGWLFWTLLRRLDIRKLPAMLAAAGFTCAFARLHLYLYRGVFPQAFTSAFLVLLFIAADGLLRDRGRRWLNAVLFAVATFGLIVNHQPHALFAALYLAVFGAAAIATGLWRLQRMAVLVLAGLIGAVSATVVVVPTIVEAPWVMIEPAGAMFAWRLPTPTRLLNLLLWRDTRTTWGTDYWAYLGLGSIAGVVCCLACMARNALPRGRMRIAVPAAICLALSLLVWNPAVREIQFTLLFTGILAAVGFDALWDAPALRGHRRLAVMVLILADLASTSVQPVARTDKNFLIDAGRMLERTDPGQRIVEMQVARNGTLQVDLGPDGGPISYDAMVQRVAGNHNMAASRLHNSALVTLHAAQENLQHDGMLAPETATALSVLNVGHVICEQAEAMGCPAAIRGTNNDPALGRDVRLPDATPVVFSNVLFAAPQDPSLEKPMFWPDDFDRPTQQSRIQAIATDWSALLAAEGLDLQARTARAIAVRASPPVTAASSKRLTTFSLLHYNVELTSVRITVASSAPGYVQLAHPWIPSTIVTVNGTATAMLHGALGLIVLPIPAGTSTIVLREGWTPVRSASLIVSLSGLAAMVALGVVLARRDQRIAAIRRGPETSNPTPEASPIS